MNFWPPVTVIDYMVVVLGIPAIVFVGYKFVRLISYGVISAYFEARREYYKKMKGDLDSWQRKEK